MQLACLDAEARVEAEPGPGFSYRRSGKLLSITRARCRNVMRFPGLALTAAARRPEPLLKHNTKAITWSMRCPRVFLTRCLMTAGFAPFKIRCFLIPFRHAQIVARSLVQQAPRRVSSPSCSNLLVPPTPFQTPLALEGPSRFTPARCLLLRSLLAWIEKLPPFSMEILQVPFK